MRDVGNEAGRGAGRPKAGEEPLTRERILSVALGLVDEEGMGALSMRRLGAKLGVDPTSIYHHLPSKDAVVSGLVELVFAQEMRLPQNGRGSWQERVRSFARAHRDVTRGHPNLVLYVVSNAASAPAGALSVALEAREYLYEALCEAGLSPRGIVQVAALVMDYVDGFALAEFTENSGQSVGTREVLAQIEARSARRFSTIRYVLEEVAEEELRADFEFGLDVLIAGIEVRAAAADRR